jgi:hypothetical protein
VGVEHRSFRSGPDRRDPQASRDKTIGSAGSRSRTSRGVAGHLRPGKIITAREESASIACASNAPFSEWGATFIDPRLAAAVVDRLTFNAHIIQTGSNSYRLTATTRARKETTTT